MVAPRTFYSLSFLPLLTIRQQYNWRGQSLTCISISRDIECYIQPDTGYRRPDIQSITTRNIINEKVENWLKKSIFVVGSTKTGIERQKVDEDKEREGERDRQRDTQTHAQRQTDRQRGQRERQTDRVKDRGTE